MTRSMTATATAVVVSFLAFGVAGAGSARADACAMSYAAFEAAISHVDVAECPKNDLGKEAFCRASAGGDHVHVFFFDKDGDQCLLKLQSYDEDQFELRITDR